MRRYFGGALLLAGFALVVIGVTPRQATAQSVMVGSFGSNSNCIPFDCGSGFTDIPDYEQVFASSLFSGPVLINQLVFFRATIEAFGPPVYRTGTYTFSLGYTGAGIGGLSSNLPSNFSSGPSLFASMSLSGAQASTLPVSGTPFLYDPSLGNLLFDVTASSTADGVPAFFADGTSSCSRAYVITGVGGTDGECLVTEIDFTNADVGGPTVTPEPAALSLLATGLVGVAGASVRRRKKRE
jgi:hypothetical protein